MDDRPRGRERHVTGQGKDIGKYGSGLGTGPVGSTGGAGRKNTVSGGGGRSSGSRGGGGFNPLIAIALVAVMALGGGGSLLGGLLGGSSSTSTPVTQSSSSSSSGTQQLIQQAVSGFTGSQITSLLGNSTGAAWSGSSGNVGKLNTQVAPGAREKRTVLKGNGKDTVTLLVYLCGTDLESKYSMGTADLSEMAAADTDNLNIIVYTGGCAKWKNNIVSSSVNQIYKVEKGGLKALVKDAGKGAMTDPKTLTSFIQYGAKNYPADRMCLIFWDHGGGSLSGYGYDEKNPGSSMGLSKIDQALKAGGVTFDFIGFDACLMGTLENALMLADYADYMIASEETEPGVGWYYTDWLTRWNKNTSMPTTELGKLICDDFVRVCAEKCRGQSTTLSVVDLAELEVTAPKALSGFAQSTSSLIQGGDYQQVSRARSGCREFATSNKLDQVDLVDLANRLGTDEAKTLASALLSAVKYNNTNTAMTNAYGLSIYFPYQRANKVSTATATYEAIDMNDDYARCIQQFASMGTAGQAVSSSSASGYAGNPLGSLLSGAVGSSSTASSDMIGQLLGELLVTALSNRAMPEKEMTEYLTLHQFDQANLVWKNGRMILPAEQWELVNQLDLNLFYDVGNGYVDMGLDNVINYTDDGALVGEFYGTWLAIDQQPVAYYHTRSTDSGLDYADYGYVPVLWNGEPARLLLTFDKDNPRGYISGIEPGYNSSETETAAKAVPALEEGDEIRFLCDFYGYDGTYQDSYFLTPEPWLYHKDALISDVTVDASRANAAYRFVDIYGQSWWTPPMT